MKLVGLIMVVASAAACAPSASNDGAPAPEQDMAGSASGSQAAPGGSQKSDGAETRPRPDVPIAGPGGTPPDPSGDEADPCGASRYQWLVGRPRSAIPATPSGANWRVACTSCPVTQDYVTARLNIFYDSETGRVEEVRCG